MEDAKITMALNKWYNVQYVNWEKYHQLHKL